MDIRAKQEQRAQSNKAIVQRFYDAIDTGRLDLLNEVLTVDFEDQDHNGVTGARAGRQAFERCMQRLWQALPDSKTTVRAMAAEGDRVMVLRVHEATHREAFAGFAPTGRRVALEAIEVFQVVLGRIANYWHLYDGAVLSRELQAPLGAVTVAVTRTPLDILPQRSAEVRERNKAVVRYMHEGIDRQNWSVLDEVLSPDFVDHGATDVPPTAMGIKMMYERVYKGLPDAYTVLHDVLADAEDVVVRRTCYCTHQGEMWGIPASGRRVSVGLVNWFRLRDRGIASHWHAFDSIGLRRQLSGQAALEYV
jgi:steroid delta-isomerase-like uncharacterized protein